MSRGTITVTNKSDKVVGVGTAFTTDLKAGDVMVMPVGTGSFTLIVKSIESETRLTLMEPFRGPTLSGQSWSAVPYETMLRINAQLSTQTGVAIYGLNMDKQNWQAVFSESGDITVTLPDATTFTGPSWSNISSKVGNLSALGIGGTGTALATLDWQTFDFVPGARYMVLSGNMKNVPVGIVVPGTTYQTVINVTGYDGSTRHVEMWYSTTTVANYYHYEVRIGGAAGSKGFIVRQIWTSTDVIPLANTALSTIGIGGYSTSISNFDWQTAKFEQGGHYNVNCSNWLNTPPGGLPTGSLAMIEVVAIHNQEGDNRRYVLRVSQILQGSARQMWDIVGYGASGSRTWTVDSYLIFSSAAAGRQKLGFNDLGIGGQISALPSFDWQTFAFETSAHYNVSANSWTGAPSELSSISGNAAIVVVASTGNQSASTAWNMLELTTYNNSSSRKIFSVVCYGPIGARTFSVSPVLTKADLDSRVGYALLAPSDNMTKGQRLVLANPFGNNTPVTVRAELLLGSVWVNTGWLYHPNYGGYGTNASYSEGEGIIVQGGSFLLNTTAGNAGGSSGTSTLELTTGKVRVHVFKVTS